jgi:hypothetical protein
MQLLKGDSHMKTREELYTKQEVFFATVCGAFMSVPDCRGCEHNIKDQGCDHEENPINVIYKEITNGK